ncbi:MAG: hypothetical protein P4L86_19810 [Mycobacterium sp.]|nr:hypothetical protein [Mycobacterium sp.]
MRITVKTLGLVIGGAAIAASVTVVVAGGAGVSGRGVLAKSSPTLSSPFPFSSSPPAYLRSGGSDSGVITSTTSPGS